MVTCCLKKCRKRTNLDEDGYCPEHSQDNTENENCGKCGQAVPNDQSSKALQCENEQCQVWFHLSCTNIPEELFAMINDVSEDEDAGIRWLCTVCRTKPIVHTATSTEVLNSGRTTLNKPVCSKLKQGKCPHGISGHKEVDGKICEYSHPKFCKKFTRNGFAGRYGCKGCTNFHPTLCRNSVKYRKCLNQKCTFVHLKGTQRKEYPGQAFPPNSVAQYPSITTTPVIPGIDFQSQNAWQGRPAPSANYQRSSNHNSKQSRFLGAPQPQSQSEGIASLQMQINCLGDLLKQVLNSPLANQSHQMSCSPPPQQYQSYYPTPAPPLLK